jgi:anti-anti-sigma factor
VFDRQHSCRDSNRPPASGPWVGARIRCRPGSLIVDLSGEIDIAAHEQVVRVCSAIAGVHVTVDLSRVTFLDTAGHRSLCEAATRLQERGGTLELTGMRGEPARLLGVVDRLSLTR